MKTITTLLFSMLILSGIAQENDYFFSESVNKFAFDLYKTVGKDNKNIIFSPFSISSALSMTYCGAKANTKKAMQKVLYLPENTELTTSAYTEYKHNLGSSFVRDNINLKIANSLWGEKSYPFKKKYVKLVKNKFEAPFYEVDFIKETEKARNQINNWVENQTQNKIKNLIPKNVLTENTRLVLTNAIYFYGGWEKAFNPKANRKADFYISQNKTKKVDFLHANRKLFYFENELFKAVEIPYKGKAASLMLFMPKNIEDFDKLYKALDFNTFVKWNKQMKKAMVSISVPKFDVESDFELSEVLSKMGMKLAFSNSANFSGISRKNDLKIDKVIHKAKIAIDENGTEAAAATAVVMVRKTSISGKLKLVEFNADRPFVFLLKENKNNSILFMGKVVNP